jgi:hypothetical protein
MPLIFSFYKHENNSHLKLERERWLKRKRKFCRIDGMKMSYPACSFIAIEEMWWRSHRGLVDPTLPSFSHKLKWNPLLMLNKVTSVMCDNNWQG